MALDKRKKYQNNTNILILFLLSALSTAAFMGCKTTSEPMVPDNQALVYIFSPSRIAAGGFSIGRYNEKFLYSLEAKTYNYYLFSPGQIMLLRGGLPAYEKIFEVKAGKKYYIYFDSGKKEFQAVTDEAQINKLLKTFKFYGEDTNPEDIKEQICPDDKITLFDYAATALDENLLTLLMIKGTPYNEEAIPEILVETQNNGNHVLYSYLEGQGFVLSEPEAEPGAPDKPEISDAALDDLEDENGESIYFEPDRYYSEDHSFSIKYPENWHTSETSLDPEPAKKLFGSSREQKKLEFRAVNPVTEPDILALVSVSTIDLDELNLDRTGDAELTIKTGETADTTSDVITDATSDTEVSRERDVPPVTPSLLERAFLNNIEHIKQDVFGFEEFERGEVTLDERTFKWILYTDQMILIKKYYFVTNEKLYIIKCSALPEEYSKFDDQFLEMVSSIRFE